MAGLTDACIGGRFDQVERLARVRIQSDRFLAQDTGRFMRWVRGLRRTGSATMSSRASGRRP